MNVIIGPSLSAIGGISTFLADLIKNTESDYKIKYIDTYQIKKRLNTPRRSFLSIFELFSGIKVFIYLFNLLQKEKNISNIIINTSSFWGFWEKSIFVLICRIFKKNTILIVHGGDFLNFYKKSIFKKLIIFIFKRTNKTIFVSKETEEYFSNISNKKFTHLILPISNPVEFDIINNDLSEILDNYKYKFFTVNVLEKRKRVLSIIEVFINEYKDSKEACLIIAGEGEEKQEIIDKISKYNNIYFTGPIRGKEKAILFRESNIYINFSKKESFGIVIIESMLSRNLLITTPVGIASEIIKDKKNGLIVENINELAEALKESVIIINSNNKLTNMINLAESTSNEFTWNKLIKSWEKELFIKKEKHVNR